MRLGGSSGLLRRGWATAIAVLLVGGCGGSSRPVDDTTQEAPLPGERARAAQPEKAADPMPSDDPRHAVMADEIVAALRSGDYAKFDALLSDRTRKELGDITPRSYADLRKALEREGIELEKASLVRIQPAESGLVPGARVGIQTIEMFFEFEGREFNTHFNVMIHGDEYDLVGIASWVKWTDEAK